MISLRRRIVSEIRWTLITLTGPLSFKSISTPPKTDSCVQSRRTWTCCLCPLCPWLGASGNPAFCNIGLLGLLLGLLCPGLLGLCQGLTWFAVRTWPCFPRLRGSQIHDVTCIPPRTATSTAYLGFCVQPRHKVWSNVWWSGCPVWPPPQIKVQKKPGLSVGETTPSRFLEDLAA